MKTKAIPNQKGIPIVEFFMKELRDYLPLGNYKPLITKKQQQEVIKKLNANIDRANFSFIIDGVTGNIIHAIGIQKWLAYPDNTFSTKNFLSIIHPGQAISQWMNGGCLWNGLDKHRDWVNFYDISEIASISLKHANGEYINCRCEASIFQLTADKKALEFCYEFSILKKHDSELFTVCFFDKTGIRSDIQIWLQKAKKEKFKSVRLFTDQEIRILQRYACNEKTTSQNIADAFKIRKETVDTHNTNILDKAEKYFYYRFDSAKKFAQHLRLLELI